MQKVISISEAAAQILSGDQVFIHGGDATPKFFLEHLTSRHKDLKGVTLYHLHTHGEATYTKPEFAESFNVKNLFVGSNIRKKINYKNIDYIPCALSEIPSLFREGYLKLDWAVVQVSPPDQDGCVSLGTSLDVTLAAVKSAKKVIAQVNPQMPRVLGDGILPLSDFDFVFEQSEDIALPHETVLSDIDRKIGKNVAALIEDGSTLQVGIGSMPDAVLQSLKSHKNLGLHTEMWTSACLDLLKSGVINNSQKKLYPGKSLSAFIIGNEEVYDFIHNNPEVIQKPASYVNLPEIIKQNPKVCAVNSAVEIDLTGQICADSIGPRIISGVGGQSDFMRGAALSEGGKPIIALHSRTKSGKSKIVSMLKQGGGVVTCRSRADYIVTEYGAVSLKGKALGERAKSLISIAHPEDREVLEREWFEIRL